MASKRDQLHAYQFLVQRVVSALVTRESDPEQPPFRRPGLAAAGSIALSVIALAVVGVYGFIVPGGKDSWRDGSSVIVEKETGTRHVYLEGRLHPVTNYASARLLVDGGESLSVSAASLAGVPRGPRIGIPDAPDALPDREHLLGGGWNFCSQPSTTEAGAPEEDSVLLVGHDPRGGAPLGDKAVLVEVSESGNHYLIWRGYRHRIDAKDTVDVGAALKTTPQMRVDEALLNVLPAGAELRPMIVGAAGRKSRAVPSLPDLRAGQLLVSVSGGFRQYYLADTDVLRPITPLQYEIQRANPRAVKAYRGSGPKLLRLDPIEVRDARLAGKSKVPSRDDLPESRPEFAGADGESTLCAGFAPGGEVPRMTVDAALPEPDRLQRTRRTSDEGTPLADRVIVPPGRAAVVAPVQNMQAPASTTVVITDGGRGYPLAADDVLAGLGYENVKPVRMLAGLVDRIPRGNGLDPAAALEQTNR